MGEEKRTGRVGHLVAALAEQQHGVVTRGQLKGLGLGDRAVDHRIESGYLRPLFPATFAVGHAAITRQGRMLGAVLACGEKAVLSHGSAAEHLGLWSKRLPVAHIIPPDWSGRKISGIRWHRVRFPLDDELVVRDGIRCTTVSRTIVDMAGESGWTRLRALVEQAAILGQLDAGDIDLVLSRGRRRGAPRLRAILAGWRTDTESRPRIRSRLEARLLPLLNEEGLPVPRTNVKLAVGGKELEVDFLWETRRLVIETDGEETHGTKVAFNRDRWRDQMLIAAGYRTARVTWAQIRDEPNAVIHRIARMLTVA